MPPCDPLRLKLIQVLAAFTKVEHSFEGKTSLEQHLLVTVKGCESDSHISSDSLVLPAKILLTQDKSGSLTLHSN